MTANQVSRLKYSAAILAILAAASWSRLYGIGFGLPALYDPDEPLFVVSGLKLIGERTLNPGWFGHPGTTTIYALALIDLLVVAWTVLTGVLPDAKAVAVAAYADPTILVLPGRIFIAACGVACVALIFQIGRITFGIGTGLVAAALLALNPLHIQWSQVIRTDVHASVFMLLGILFSIGIAAHGRRRDFILAGLMIGLGCATKWPAAAIIVCPIGAAWLRARSHPSERPAMLYGLALAGAVSALTLFAASPYLILDYQTALANIAREGRGTHLGATGGAPLTNAAWYADTAIRGSVGLVGLALATAGVGIGAARSLTTRAIIVPAAIVFFVAICAESLVWARWFVPLLPLLSLFVAVAICFVADRLVPKIWRPAAAAGILAVIAVPMMLNARAAARERATDTRALASAWIERNVPAGRTIVLEHLALDLDRRRWRFLFPGGRHGCIDANRLLAGRARYQDIEALRGGQPILDLGTIAPARIATCRADYAILSHDDRYRAEARRYPVQVAMYDRIRRSGTVVRSFRPESGRIGGPVIHIVRLTPPAAAVATGLARR